MSTRMTRPAQSRGGSRPVYSRILAATDFSSFSDAALVEADRLSQQTGAELMVVHVLGPILDDGATKSLYAETAQKIRQQVKRLKIVQSEIKIVVQNGVPSREIVELATKTGAELVVIGTQGVTGLKRVLLGSTAEWVVRHATCPVLVVRGRRKAVRPKPRGDITSLLSP